MKSAEVHLYDIENRWRNQDIVRRTYFDSLVEWLTDLTVQTAFWEMGGASGHSAESHFLEGTGHLHSEESLNTPKRTQHPGILDSSTLAD